MEEKKSTEQFQGLSGPLMELFVSNLLTKNDVDVEKVKKQITDEQREQLRNTVEQLKAQVNEYLESKTVQRTTGAEEKTGGQAVNPPREALIQKEIKKEIKKVKGKGKKKPHKHR